MACCPCFKWGFKIRIGSSPLPLHSTGTHTGPSSEWEISSSHRTSLPNEAKLKRVRERDIVGEKRKHA